MIIVCPNCARRYMVDDEKISASGRNVRCAICRFEWNATLHPSETVKNSIAPEEIITHPANIPSPPFWKKKGVLGWIIYGVVAASLLLFFSLGRNFILHTWPSSSGFYQLLSDAPLAKAPAEIQDVEVHFLQEKGIPLMVFTGKIHNNTGHTITINPLKVTILSPCKDRSKIALSPQDPHEESPTSKPDDRRCPSEQLEFPIAQRRLQGGSSIVFETQPMAISPHSSTAILQL